MHDFHSNLLAGPKGRTVNGFVAVVLMTLALSGLVMWLPRQQWLLSFRVGWKRQIWNLHNAVGFLAFVLLALQGFMGAYFAFPNVYRAALGLPPPPRWTWTMEVILRELRQRSKRVS